MANWRQIQARIRKAKSGPEAPTKLADLYNKTRDAMVAFELATLQEKEANSAEAVRWYTTAAERFRRADWKSRAEDALTRLGAPIPSPRVKADQMQEVNDQSDPINSPVHEDAADDDEGSRFNRVTPIAADSAIPEEEIDEVNGNVITQPKVVRSTHAGAAAGPAGKRGRRGRRGGRGRKRGAAGMGLPPETFTPPRTFPQRGRETTERAYPTRPSYVSKLQPEPVAPPPEPETPTPPSQLSTSRIDARAARDTHGDAPVSLPSERVMHGRGREPALASRLANLESLLRRLLGSQLHSLDAADEAPAGPGVLLLSDSELVDSYYVESCQTLRVAMGQLVRGGRSQRREESGSLKERLAEHLGINENKVGDYLKKHCVVRWIQLDEEAHHLAHFAIGVLRTPLNIS